MTKGKILQGIWDKLPLERKQRILARAEKLEAEYRYDCRNCEKRFF